MLFIPEIQKCERKQEFLATNGGGGVNKLHFLIAELIIQNDRLIIFLIFKKSRLKLLVNKSLFINLRI